MLLDEDCGPHSSAVDFVDDLPASASSLAPDPEKRFQRRSFDASELHQYLVNELGRRFSDTRPNIILCCGKCRVGSTPLANVFGHAGLPALYQPMKSLLRHRLVGEPCPEWSLSSDRPTVFLKETFGPYVAAECTFSPLKVLLDIGFQRQDIKLLVLERDPRATIESWWRCWHDRLDPKEFAKTFFLASINVHRTAAMAASAGMQVEYYLHEESKNPDVAISRLFHALGLGGKFNVSILRNWAAGDSLRGANTAVKFFSQPKDYWIDDIHLELSEYRFVPQRRDVLTAPLQSGDVMLLDQLCQLYRHVREHVDRARSNESAAGQT